ncbi:hypothetical protein M231_03282 [Tremella mesenterica]|uniref:Uncharacterized protein n=1 Tax=Tremella mesenterica TaxID=5217 RepID=A0A4Q1BNK2_TREME|nr:hypothetical protein M231_03282 [Tremella mesenterica]
MNNTPTKPLTLASLLNPQPSLTAQPSTVPVSLVEETELPPRNSIYSREQSNNRFRPLDRQLTADQRMISRLNQNALGGMTADSSSSFAHHPCHFPDPQPHDASDRAFPSSSDAFGPQPQYAWYGDDTQPWRDNHSVLLNSSIPPQASNRPRLTYQTNRLSSAEQLNQNSSCQPSRSHVHQGNFQCEVYDPSPRSSPSRESVGDGTVAGKYVSSPGLTRIEGFAIAWDQDDEEHEWIGPYHINERH